MPEQRSELEDIVQRMLDAGESEDNIALVIRDYTPSQAESASPFLGNTPSFIAPAKPSVLRSIPFVEDIIDTPIGYRTSVGDFAGKVADAGVGFVKGGARSVLGMADAASMVDPRNVAAAILGGTPQSASEGIDAVRGVAPGTTYGDLDAASHEQAAGGAAEKAIEYAMAARGALAAGKGVLGRAMNTSAGRAFATRQAANQAKRAQGLLFPTSKPLMTRAGEKVADILSDPVARKEAAKAVLKHGGLPTGIGIGSLWGLLRGDR